MNVNLTNDSPAMVDQSLCAPAAGRVARDVSHRAPRAACRADRGGGLLRIRRGRARVRSPPGREDRRRSIRQRAATLLFIPGPVRTPEPVLAADLEQLPGFAVGLFSPTLGRYSPTQMMLDISQGSRVASSLYKPVAPPPPGFEVDQLGLERRQRHASSSGPRSSSAPRDVPGDIVPGLLGCAVKRVGQPTRLDQPMTERRRSPESPPPTRAGRVDSLVIAPRGQQLESNSLKAQHYSDVVVGTLPAGGVGFGIARKLAAADPDRLIIIVQAPPEPARTRLLTLAVRGIDGGGGLRSATTRRDGLVAATDIAPTILERLEVEPPSDMQGQPIEGAPRMTAAELNEMNDRLSLVSGRRAPLGRSVILIGGLIIILLLLVGRLTGRYAEISRLTQRLVGLAVLWLPLMLLVTAALQAVARRWRPTSRSSDRSCSRSVTDRLVRWPRALFVPVLFVVIAHGLDFLVLERQAHRRVVARLKPALRRALLRRRQRARGGDRRQRRDGRRRGCSATAGSSIRRVGSPAQASCSRSSSAPVASAQTSAA